MGEIRNDVLKILERQKELERLQNIDETGEDENPLELISADTEEIAESLKSIDKKLGLLIDFLEKVFISVSEKINNEGSKGE